MTSSTVTIAGEDKLEPLLDVVILNYRTPSITLQAAKAVREATRSIHTRILIVDNDECAGSALDRASEIDPGFRIARTGRNLGFGGGMNYGIRRGSAPFCLALNSDVMLSASTVRACLAEFADGRVGLVGCGARAPDGTPLWAFDSFPRVWRLLLKLSPASSFVGWLASKGRDRPSRLPDTLKASRSVDFVSGAILFFRREAFSDIDGFDERFFLYFEEPDISLRLAKKGWATRAAADYSSVHLNSQSPQPAGAALRHYEESAVRYLRNYHGFVAATLARALVTGARLVRRIRASAILPSGG